MSSENKIQLYCSFLLIVIFYAMFCLILCYENRSIIVLDSNVSDNVLSSVMLFMVAMMAEELILNSEECRPIKSKVSKPAL